MSRTDAATAVHDPTLDALIDESRQMNELVAAFQAQVPGFDTPEGLAALRDANGFFGRAEIDGVALLDIPGPAGPIPARVLVPATFPTTPAAAVHLDLHGGGWCIGSAQGEDANNRQLADTANVVVVAIDYRLAPEDPFPAGPDDCFATVEWLLAHAEAEWGTDRLTIGGASAGAHLAAVTLLRVRDELGADALRRIAGANLLFGPYDLGLTPSQRRAADALVIPLATMEAVYAHALPGLDREARRDPRWSPLYADLAGLPPALFTVGTLDPLYDDSLFMAARWRAAGNDATLRVYPESVHAFPSFPTDMGRHATAMMHDWIRGIAASPTP